MGSKAQIIDFLLAGYRTKATDLPLNAGTVDVTVAGTANVAYVWDDRDKTLPTTTGRSTVTLDAYGKAEVYGDGIYKFVIKDSAASTVETIDYAEYKTATGSDGLVRDTLAEMKAIDVSSLSDNTNVVTQGRLTVGDGGGGSWYWDSSDLSAKVTADSLSGLYAAPTSDATGASGAWVRLFTGGIRAVWFGVVAGDDSVAVANYTAIRAAVAMCTYYPVNGIEGQNELIFENGEIYITGNSVLCFNRTDREAIVGSSRYRRGFKISGQGKRSTILILKTDAGGDLRFYSNYDAAYPGDMSNTDYVTFNGITFRGTEQTYAVASGSKTNGFYLESSGWEKFITFYNCDFEYLDNAFHVTGTANADHNRWFGCKFANIRDEVFIYNNDQSVANSFFGCDMELIYGDCFKIGGLGGGDITWVSGSVVLLPELDSGGTPLVSQSDKGFINWDNSGTTTGGTSGAGNNQFRFKGLRFEVYDASQKIIRAVRTDATVYGSLRPTFEDCSLVNIQDYPSGSPSTDYELFSVGNNMTCMLIRCTLSQYITYQVTKFDSEIQFIDCVYQNEVPMVTPYDLLQGKCSVSSTTGGSISSQGLVTQKQVILGSTTAITNADFVIGGTPRLDSVFTAQGKHPEGAWPQVGLISNKKLYLHEGEVVYRVAIAKPAETVAAPIADYGLSIVASDATVLLAYAAGLEDRAIFAQSALTTPWLVPAYPNNYIELTSGGSTGSQVFTDLSGSVIVEYL